MREELLSLKVGQKKLDKEWMSISKIADFYSKTFQETTTIVEELIQSGHLKPIWGADIFWTKELHSMNIGAHQ
jgi:hypothetical protein